MQHPDPSRRRLLQRLGAVPLLLSTLLTACSLNPMQPATNQPTPVPAAVVAAFAPTGALRASINLGNPILANKGADGQPVGVSVDLARALAERLAVPLQLVVFDAAARSVDAVKTGQADIGFFAIDPLRSDGVRFSAPYVQIEGAYLVKQDSALTENAQVDTAGTRVMVGKGSAYDLFLSREIKAATLLRAPTSPKVVDSFIAENADVAAGVRQQLEMDASRLGGLRLLPGRFMVIEQAMGVQANRGDAAQALLKRFVEDAKRSGMVAESLRRHGIQGAIVAPGAAA